MLINLTNHPSANWPPSQMEQAQIQWGAVVDVPFPNVPPAWGRQEVCRCAEALLEHVKKLSPDAVLCQGEMTLCFLLVQWLKAEGIPVFAAISERITTERSDSSGGIVKQSEYHFRRFREYP